MRGLCNAVVILSLVLGARAQSTHSAGVFPTIDHSGKVTRSADYGLYYFLGIPLIELSNTATLNQPSVLLLYAEHAFNYSFNDYLSGTAAYVYQEENAFEPNVLKENRIHLQFAVKHGENGNQFKHRVRHDSRFLQEAFKHRARYQFSYKKELSTGNYFVLGQEFFIELTDAAPRLYNENWANVCYGIRLGERNSLELGMLYVTWNTGASNWRHQWYFQPTWVSKLDFTNK
jgi:hypothetical protein